MYQDAHVHFQKLKDSRYLDEWMSAARQQQVGRFFCNGTSPEDWAGVNDLARQYPSIVPFFGIHPWFIGQTHQGWEIRLRDLLRTTSSGIGEVGLDRCHGGRDFSVQIQIFARQLELAVDLGRPFVLHAVHAWDEVFRLLEETGWKGLPFIVHSFHGSWEIAKELLARGGYLSLSADLLAQPLGKTKKMVSRLPLDRILLETDFSGGGGGTSVAASSEDFLRYGGVVKKMYEDAAGLLGCDTGRLEEVIWANGSVFAH